MRVPVQCRSYFRMTFFFVGGKGGKCFMHRNAEGAVYFRMTLYPPEFCLCRCGSQSNQDTF